MCNIHHEGWTAIILEDKNPDNPRDWDNLGSMACFHRRYNLGDHFENRLSQDEAKQVEKDPQAIVLPMFLYDHGGITVNTTGFSCPWDSGQIGIIHITPDKLRDEMKARGWKVLTNKRREALRDILRDEVKVYDQYLTGDAYGFRILDPEGEEVESCFGFYGEDYAEEEALRVIKSEIQHRKKTKVA